MVNVQRSARAGAAAFALGLSLAWPVTATAAADSTGQDSSSVSAGPAKSSHAAKPARAARQVHDRPAASKPAAAGSTGSSRSAAPPVADLQTRTDAASARAALTGHAPSRSSRRITTPVAVDTADAGSADVVPTQTETATDQRPAAATDTVSPPSAVPVTTTPNITALRLPSADAQLSSVTDAFSQLVNNIGGFIDGAVLLVRRSLFNSAPTVAPVQITGQTTGPITGTIGATDPDGDGITYAVRQEPHFGTVTVDSAGNYTYTPTAEFNGIDAFTVAATDTGFHINLLDLFRAPSTDAVVSVSQDANNTPRITFNFIYGSGSQYWSSASRAALASTAIYLSSYFVVTTPVTLTYDVTGQYSLAGSTLASAGSDLISSQPGFYSTVVQNKILTGVDSNGSAADGVITWNFGYAWGYGSSVTASQYDFNSTAMHELVHTFGFLSVIDSAGNNTGSNWTTYDGYVVTSAGTPVIGNDYAFKTGYNGYLTGTNGGLYFGGPNAVAAYGGPVPLYTPNPWESGSSMSHLRDSSFTGANTKLMNSTSGTGPGVRTLSPVEIGILKDLGYTMVSQPPNAVLLFVGLVFLRRRKQR
ncbi:hypothetical protein B1R94_24675 [Mycolicibacterium litorale]|nr:hypothetical protein B1R94_24675 [Mycolicibacterium litorale]